MAILGLTMVNRNGYPMTADPAQAESAVEKQAREALATGNNPYALAKTGYQLSFSGHDSQLLAQAGVRSGSTGRKHAAACREPCSWLSGCRLLLTQHREIQHQRGWTPPPQTSAVPPAPAAAPVPAIDLEKVSVGTTREELLKLGQPAGRLSLPDGGHLVEMFQYSVNGATLGTVRLIDGAVSQVQIP